jgi:superfamily II DNA/RNA helicase
MSVRGEGVPKPVRSFEEACFPDYLLQEIAKAGFKNPTAIQCQVLGPTRTSAHAVAAFFSNTHT